MPSRILSIAPNQALDEVTTVTRATDMLLVRQSDGDIVGIEVDELLSDLGAYRQTVGPAEVTLAADQTDTDVPLSAAGGYVVPRDGHLTAVSGIISAAVTGSGQDVTVQVQVGGSDATGFTLSFTQAGGETEASATPTAVAVSAGDVITVLYDSDTITNTPELAVWVQFEESA
jgi:hypothetical protein